VTVIAGGVTVTWAVALLVVSATLVAATVCGPPAWLGAVYKPMALIVPAVAFPPWTPSTDHVTAVLLVPVTVAVNGVVPLTGTEADVCDSVTLIWAGGGVDGDDFEPQPARMRVAKARETE
jgi:hypothetical protein